MLSFRLTPHAKFSLACLEGLVSVDAWDAVLDEIALTLRARAAPRRLVIDLTAVVGYLGIPERQAVGGLMARHLAGWEKVALVVQAHKITRVVHDEAQRNGLNLQLFPIYDDAVAWATA